VTTRQDASGQTSSEVYQKSRGTKCQDLSTPSPAWQRGSALSGRPGARGIVLGTMVVAGPGERVRQDPVARGRAIPRNRASWPLPRPRCCPRRGHGWRETANRITSTVTITGFVVKYLKESPMVTGRGLR
jgi:hypothetical protein